MLSDMFAFPVSSAITLPSLRELRLGDALSAHSLPPQAADGVQYSEDNHAYTFVVPLPSGLHIQNIRFKPENGILRICGDCYCILTGACGYPWMSPHLVQLPKDANTREMTADIRAPSSELVITMPKQVVLTAKKDQNSHQSRQLIPNLSSRSAKDEGAHTGCPPPVALDASGRAAGMLPDVIDLVSGVPQLQPSGLRSCWIGSFQPVRELSPQELLSYTGVSRFPSGLGPRFGEYLVNLTKEASKQAVGKAGAADSRARPKLTTQNGGFEERKAGTKALCDDSISSRYSLENFLADNLLADKHLSMASAFQPKEYKETVPCNPSLKASNGKGPELVSTRSAKTENESALAEPAQSGSHHGCIRDGVLEKSEGSNTKGGVSACDDGSLSASSAVFLDHQSAKKMVECDTSVEELGVELSGKKNNGKSDQQHEVVEAFNYELPSARADAVATSKVAADASGEGAIDHGATTPPMLIQCNASTEFESSSAASSTPTSNTCGSSDDGDSSEESDGSWVDVSDEEPKDSSAGKGPLYASVLEAITEAEG